MKQVYQHVQSFDSQKRLQLDCHIRDILTWHGPTEQADRFLLLFLICFFYIPHNHKNVLKSDDNTKQYQVVKTIDLSGMRATLTVIAESSHKTSPLLFVLHRQANNGTPFVCLIDVGAGEF
jgi:hypothetical protein